MANPSLLESFAGSSTNKVAPSAGLQLNGYSFEEILASGNYNYMIEQLYAASNKSKFDGIWDWESGTYELGALVKHIGSTWESTAGANTSEPGIANWKPYVYKAEVTHDVVVGEVTTGSATIILTPSENASKRIIITDTGALTSVAGELLISSDVRDLIVVNNDNVDLKVWRDNGAGVGTGGFITVLAGETQELYCDGTNVTYLRGVTRYRSAEQTITSAGQLILAHGLPLTPRLFQAFLVNKVAEGTYSIGDTVPIALDSRSSAASDDRGIQAVIDTTNITIRYGASASVFHLLVKTTGLTTNFTNANWRLIIEAQI